MSENLIRRSDAIEAIEVVDWYHQNKNKDMVSGANSDEHQAWYKADDVYKALEAVPSADRPQGEWIEQEDDYYHYWECSECGMGVGLDDIRNFCPNCGAMMKTAENERDYERAIEQMQYDMLYEPTYNPEDGSM